MNNGITVNNIGYDFSPNPLDIDSGESLVLIDVFGLVGDDLFRYIDQELCVISLLIYGSDPGEFILSFLAGC